MGKKRALLKPERVDRAECVGCDRCVPQPELLLDMVSHVRVGAREARSEAASQLAYGGLVILGLRRRNSGDAWRRMATQVRPEFSSEHVPQRDRPQLRERCILGQLGTEARANKLHELARRFLRFDGAVACVAGEPLCKQPVVPRCVVKDSFQDRRWLGRGRVSRSTGEVLVGDPVWREHLVDNPVRVPQTKHVTSKSLQLWFVAYARLLELHENRTAPIALGPGQIDDYVRRNIAAHVRLDEGPELEVRVLVLRDVRRQSGNRDWRDDTSCLWHSPHFRNKGSELLSSVVPNNDTAIFDAFRQVPCNVILERMHQGAPSSAGTSGRRRPPRPRPRLPVATGASSRLFNAAFTAGEARSRTSSSMDRVGDFRDVHLPSVLSTQKICSTPWAIARLRSVAHFGRTRSGHRCIARCTQSCSPSQSASQVAFSSCCHCLC